MAVAIGFASTALGCKRSEAARRDVTDIGMSGHAAPPGPDPAASANDDGHPVYPDDTAAPDPLAVRACASLQDLPRQRRAACRGTTPGISFADLCANALGSAMRARTVRVDAPAVDACAGALAHQLQGCDWAKTVDAPVPPECEGFVHGVLPEGATCRSALECLDGLHCQGVGPTAAGRCRSPLRDATACGAAVDPLAVYVRQSDMDRTHPECSGVCADHRCVPRVERGGACRSRMACGLDDACVNGRCVQATAAAR